MTLLFRSAPSASSATPSWIIGALADTSNKSTPSRPGADFSRSLPFLKFLHEVDGLEVFKMELLAPQRDVDKLNVQSVDKNSEGSFSFSF